jgi:MerR family transcriptional regulator/heat shock protein HspR
MARKDTGLFDNDQGVFMISVAAELAGMHPQTLRIYESRGLIKPKRSPKKTRLYSQRDVERLRRIQELTTEVGLNLAGVERVLELEQVMDTMQGELNRMRAQAEELEREMLQRIHEVHRSYKRELVRWEPPGEIQRRADFKPPVRVRVERPHKTEGRKTEGRRTEGRRTEGRRDAT